MSCAASTCHRLVSSSAPLNSSSKVSGPKVPPGSTAHAPAVGGDSDGIACCVGQGVVAGPTVAVRLDVAPGVPVGNAAVQPATKTTAIRPPSARRIWLRPISLLSLTSPWDGGSRRQVGGQVSCPARRPSAAQSLPPRHVRVDPHPVYVGVARAGRVLGRQRRTRRVQSRVRRHSRALATLLPQQASCSLARSGC
jgi:hypothetical protein